MKIQSKIFHNSNLWSPFLQTSQFCASCVKSIFRGRVSSRAKRRAFLYTFLILVSVILYCHFFVGIFYRFFEKDFQSSFKYPENIEDFPQFLQNYKYLEKTLNTSQRRMLYRPINPYYSSVEFLKKAEAGCSNPVGLLIIVKSARKNFEKRRSVRSTWGHPSYLKNNSMSENLPTKLVFIIGQRENEFHPSWLDESKKIDLESKKHRDIISATFIDTYYNNTYKSISALRWAKEICGDFRYLFLVDDDVFISLKNFGLYLRNPMTYNQSFPDLQKNNPENQSDVTETNPFSTDLQKEHLFFGKVVTGAKPIRNKFGWNSKWYLSLEDYPYNVFPSYIPGFATLLSKSTVIDFIYASLFTRHFHIDDVYLGILAHKLKINATHCDFFVLVHRLNSIKWTEYMIAVHDNYSPEALVQIWNENGLNI